MEKQNWVRQWPWQTGGCGVRVRGGGDLWRSSMVKWVVVVGWGGGFTGWLGFKRRTGKSQGEDARQERLAVRVAGSTDRVVMVVVVVGGGGAGAVQK